MSTELSIWIHSVDAVLVLMPDRTHRMWCIVSNGLRFFANFRFNDTEDLKFDDLLVFSQNISEQGRAGSYLSAIT